MFAPFLGTERGLYNIFILKKRGYYERDRLEIEREKGREWSNC